MKLDHSRLVDTKESHIFSVYIVLTGSPLSVTSEIFSLKGDDIVFGLF